MREIVRQCRCGHEETDLSAKLCPDCGRELSSLMVNDKRASTAEMMRRKAAEREEHVRKRTNSTGSK